MSYLNSVTIVGFVGADPEQRQARNNGSKVTVLSVATQRSWKNAEDEWVSKVEWHRVAIFRPRLADAVLTNIKKGAHLWRAHVLVEGSLVSSTCEQAKWQGQEGVSGELLFRSSFLRISRPATHSAKCNLVVLFIHFNPLVRLLPASRASGSPLNAHS